MVSDDAATLRLAITDAKQHKVNPEVLHTAYEALLAMGQRSGQFSPPHRQVHVSGGFDRRDGAKPLGLQVSRRCDSLFKELQNPELFTDVDNHLDHLCRCREARQSDEAVLRQSVFGLMEPQDIKLFLCAPDNKLWHEIIRQTEQFVWDLADDDKFRAPLDSVEEMTPSSKDERLQNLNPIVMDHTVREPATNTPFGHTGYMKYLTLQIIRKMFFKDIAITGLYYKDSYTPENQILEELRDRKDSMEGLVAMFGPGAEDRKAGMAAIKDFKIPNAFLDLTLKASVRFAAADFVQSILEAVADLDRIFTDMGLPKDPWRTDEELGGEYGKAGMGEISLNLVDLMEFLELKTDGTMNPDRQAAAESAFRTWKANEAFQRRVVAILTEEGRGCANYMDYGTLVEWLRKFFPETEHYRILIHAHGGSGNTQDAASVESVLKGGNGVWAAIIPQAAQQGHNSSLVFLDNMLSLGNKNVLEDFWLHQAAQCARPCYYLNFNTHHIPDDCPIWGGRGKQLTHSAFCTVTGEEWRRKSSDYYDIWSDDMKVALAQVGQSKLSKEIVQLRAARRNQGSFRVSPLVSDLDVWKKRLDEARVLGGRERAGDFYKQIRSLAFALMNANIRANFDEAHTLKELARIVRDRKQRKEHVPEITNYEKAKQHQGQWE